MLKLFINNETHTFDNVQKLSEVLHHLKIENSNGIAVAVNDTVIPKSQWNSFLLNDNDKILLIKATQGG